MFSWFLSSPVMKDYLTNVDRWLILSREINSEVWFDGTLSGGEQPLVALAYNLFTNQDSYEFEDGKRYNVSP